MDDCLCVTQLRFEISSSSESKMNQHPWEPGAFILISTEVVVVVVLSSCRRHQESLSPLRRLSSATDLICLYLPTLSARPFWLTD